jgi:hypothetical protein
MKRIIPGLNLPMLRQELKGTGKKKDKNEFALVHERIIFLITNYLMRLKTALKHSAI